MGLNLCLLPLILPVGNIRRPLFIPSLPRVSNSSSTVMKGPPVPSALFPLFPGFSLVCSCLPGAGEPWPVPSISDVPQQGWEERKDHLLQPAGNVLPAAPQDTDDHFGHEGAFLAHGQLGEPSDLQVLFCRADFWSDSPLTVLLYGIKLHMVQNFAFPFAEFHEVPVSPFLQPIEAPLDANATLWWISKVPQYFYFLCSSCVIFGCLYKLPFVIDFKLYL